MAGPGSRLEKAGTIFTRVRGLLRSGALKNTEKPIWYDVYEVLRPAVEPVYERSEPHGNVPDILYKEDLIRAKFYRTYGNPDIIDMQNENSSLISERFISKYLEMRKNVHVGSTDLFEGVAEALRSDGLKLKT